MTGFFTWTRGSSFVNGVDRGAAEDLAVEAGPRLPRPSRPGAA